MAEALAEVEAGQISYLTRDGQPVAALVSIDDQAHDAMAAALDARKHEDIPPETVRAIWDAIMTSDNA